MPNLHHAALAEIGHVLDRVDEDQLNAAIETIVQAKRIALHGLGREGLQMKGLAMRLFHMGLPVAVVGDMTTPPLGPGDLLIVSVGPGSLATTDALLRIARDAGARTLLVTAQPDGSSGRLADQLLVIPAQTMADDQGEAATSVLPMGSLFEGSEFVLFEMLILRLRDRLGVTPEAMRAHHTNLE